MSYNLEQGRTAVVFAVDLTGMGRGRIRDDTSARPNRLVGANIGKWAIGGKAADHRPGIDRGARRLEPKEVTRGIDERGVYLVWLVCLSVLVPESVKLSEPFE
jgi:hypothetical protein